MSNTTDSNLKVRVFNIAHNNFDGHQDLGNCLLSQLVPDVAERAIAVKIDDELLRATKDRDYNLQMYFDQLNNLNLVNCTEVLLASGGTVFMAEPEVVAQVRDRFFADQPDHCCRYGSLLVSSCKEGIASLEQPITVNGLWSTTASNGRAQLDGSRQTLPARACPDRAPRPVEARARGDGTSCFATGRRAARTGRTVTSTTPARSASRRTSPRGSHGSRPPGRQR